MGRKSGRQSGVVARATTEDQHHIDIRWLNKQVRFGAGAQGTLSWSKRDVYDGSVHYLIKSDRIVLHYESRSRRGGWASVKQDVLLDRTACNYGGHRPWFLCSNCRRRVAVLYGAGKYFLCRHCYDLTYASQQEGKVDRLMRKSRKIRRRLQAGEDLSKPILFRPKHMHHATFDRLRNEASHAKNRSLIMIGQRMGMKFDNS